jgi:hypothetical protein
MEQFLYLGETVWRVNKAPGALDRVRYLGERTHVPHGPHMPGDWFTLRVQYDSVDRSLTLVAVESLPVVAPLPGGRPGADTQSRSRSRLGEVSGLFRRADGRRTGVGRHAARRETTLAPAHDPISSGSPG